MVFINQHQPLRGGPLMFSLSSAHQPISPATAIHLWQPVSQPSEVLQSWPFARPWRRRGSLNASCTEAQRGVRWSVKHWMVGFEGDNRRSIWWLMMVTLYLRQWVRKWWLMTMMANDNNQSKVMMVMTVSEGYNELGRWVNYWMVDG